MMSKLALGTGWGGMGLAAVAVGGIALGLYGSGVLDPSEPPGAPDAGAQAVAPPPQTPAPEAASAAPDPDPAPESPPAPEIAAAPVPPRFDTVRVEADGLTLVAGQALARASIALLVNGTEASRTQTDGSGKFAAFLDLPPSDVARSLTMILDPDGAAVPSDEEVIIAAVSLPEAAPATAEVSEPSAEQTSVVDSADAPIAEALAGAQTVPDGTDVAEVDAPETPLVDTPETTAAPTPVPEEGADVETAALAEESDDLQAVVAQAPAVDAPVAETPVVEKPVAETPAVDAPVADAPVAAAPVEDTPRVDAPIVAGAGQSAPTEGEAPVVQDEVVASEPEPSPPMVDDIANLPAPTVDTALPDALQSPADSAGVIDDVARIATDPGVDTASPVATGTTSTTADPDVSTQSTDVPQVANAAVPAPVPETSPAPAAPDAVAVANPVAVPTVIVSRQSGVEVLQSPQGPGAPPDAKVDLIIAAITYDADGDVALSGRGGGSDFVRVYLNNQQITTTRIDPDGRWRTELPQVDTGTYTLRVDQLDASGTVVARAESPFLRESREALAEAARRAQGPLSAITVQPGNTLWAIARDRYGEGRAYVRVFQANRDSIRDPDLIYPGQVFALPETE